ncbi:MAG: redox-regulated ATPase YchF [Melioribacteraceae bacterium]|nr:redox-regulated ATPase YchF [Melioribacteraceae bacterium]MCF8265864.1 redox-regulated ATPase YchF [Melioribacteraceae bacterium]MCF8432727.1 redox-regulated ATPase YchF [Melioribacteraceae bacterium]
MQIGLVGLQFSGKSTLFNIISGNVNEESSGVNEDARIEVVKVPDKRLDLLTEMFNPKKKVNATIEAYDFPGLRMADDGKVRLTTQFLENVKNNDALFYVIRQFEEPSVPHPMNDVNPVRDFEFLETEFLLTDHAFLENRIEKLKKEVMKSKDENLKKELPVIEKCLAWVENEKPLRNLNLEENEKKLLSGYQLLTLKPLSVAINLDENSISDSEKFVNELRSVIKDQEIKIIPFSAKIEIELASLSDEDRIEFMGDYGIEESALSKILNSSYKILGLHSFFTVGEDECRAWTIKKRFTAQEAAGVIHTDFYNKFIRAEVVHYQDFIDHGSFAKCKDAGVWSLEGKEYVVQDGDIINVRHS